ncbi:MAG: D-alanine--D-alanine ligase [Thermoleophilia bacterium]|nr:D-alanine--D-alanine ligase [Thermoleophilia bacterium]
MRKLNVAILAGGRSSEHDISRLSAQSILGALDTEKYNPVAVLIERSGDWRLTTADKLALHSGVPQPAVLKLTDTERAVRAADLDEPSDDGKRRPVVLRSEVRPATVTSPSNALRGIDVIFPVLHGPYGEDGTIQGLLETAGMPYVGNGVLASAVGMDKAIFKAILRDAGIEVAPGIVAHRQREELGEIVVRAESEFSYPMFVKPARLGSSIGISRATDTATLRAALELAFEHDSKLVVEAAIVGIEVECGVLGNEDPIVSVPGEVVINDDAEWFDFETKYLEGGSELRVPARISDEAAAKVQAAALAVFRAVECSGLARVDCFVTEDGRVIVNELNTMPGCTPTSAYAKLFEASGHSFNEVLDRLIQLAMDRHREQQELKH